MAKSRPNRFVDRINKHQANAYVVLLRHAAKENKSAEWLRQEVRDNISANGIQESQARAHLRRVKVFKEDPAVFLFEHQARQAEQPREKLEIKSTGSEGMAIESLSETVRTVEDALKKGGVDRDKWDIERFVVNSWEVGAKGPDKKICVTPLWQVKVWLKAKKGWSPSEFRKILIDDLRALAPAYTTPTYMKLRQPVMAELSIFDAHFGKLAWGPETGQDYDLKICRQRYMDAALDLLLRVQVFEPEQILYILGNDFFHADQGRAGLTSNGTPQDCDGRWQKAFRYGIECAIQVTEVAARIAPVHILVVPGNHDAEKSFCLGEVMAARFHQHATVTVQNDPDVHAYYRWGANLLGFVHGDNHGSDAKRAQLPTTMATDRPVDWAETRCREVHLGHFHSEMEEVWRYRTVHHVRDVAVRVLPSLSSTDAWHRRSGYKSVLAAELHLYHKNRGRYGYLCHQVDGDRKPR